MAGRRWFPESLEGRSVVLRRHVPENLSAFRRWYRDPEVARLARYQDGPMAIDEIDRFFQTRAMGTETMTMAIHIRRSDRLIGTCAFSQLDADNGSALYHITIGEKDAWGHGYGSEATRLMVDHAFGALGLHRIALAVFEFNERAIRSYLACGFEVEGRARDAIWRDGRWWDELSMSLLEPDWQRRRSGARATEVGAPAEVRPPGNVRSPAGVGSPADVGSPVDVGSPAVGTPASPPPGEQFPAGAAIGAPLRRGISARLRGY